MVWGHRVWTDYGKWHFADRNMEWKDQIEATKNPQFKARYLPDFDIRRLEMMATEFRRIVGEDGIERIELLHGRRVHPGENFFNVYIINDEDIGASRGEMTRISFIQWDEEHNEGKVHGHPSQRKNLKTN